MGFVRILCFGIPLFTMMELKTAAARIEQLLFFHVLR